MLFPGLLTVTWIQFLQPQSHNAILIIVSHIQPLTYLSGPCESQGVTQRVCRTEQTHWLHLCLSSDPSWLENPEASPWLPRRFLLYDGTDNKVDHVCVCGGGLFYWPEQGEITWASTLETVDLSRSQCHLLAVLLWVRCIPYDGWMVSLPQCTQAALFPGSIFSGMCLSVQTWRLIRNADSPTLTYLHDIAHTTLHLQSHFQMHAVSW